MLVVAIATLFTLQFPLVRSASIDAQFVERTFRIERNFVPATETKKLLHQIVNEGMETDESRLDHGTVTVFGDRGNHYADQLDKAEFASALQSFVSHELGQQPNQPFANQSLVYYLEILSTTTLQKNEELIQQVVDNSVLEDGGTIHLYLSSPGVAALDNHTDVTDIVVLQLDGEKEWLLCKEKMLEDNSLERKRNKDISFMNKLDSCSSYKDDEIEQMDCEHTVLRPGDALFLPRRVVHSARATLEAYSAHLTFGFKNEDACRNFPMLAAHRDLECVEVCDGSCDKDCDGLCNQGCDYWGDSCDSSCDNKCDEDCDKDCKLVCDLDT